VRVLGINWFSHDTAACLLEDGRLVALAEEGRFNRDRHTKRFPDQAIGFCLGLEGIGIGEVDVVAFAHRPGLDLGRWWPKRWACGRPICWHCMTMW
jgi:carbamoyltransferase